MTPDSAWKRLEVVSPDRWKALPNGRPRLFMEAPAGLAAVSLRLHGGAKCRPPISRQGNKAGYAEAVLRALGLTDGQGADAYLWAEADVDVAALLRCYPDAEMLRRVAEIIRGWKDEEPRALWERLRAERKARGPLVGAETTAGWMTEHALTGMSGGYDSASERAARGERWGGAVTDFVPDRCHRLAEYAVIASSNRLINVAGPDLMNTGKGGTTFGGSEFATGAGDVAEAFERVAGEVAGWVQQHARTDNIGKYAPESDDRPRGVWRGNGPPPLALADRCDGMKGGWPPVAVLPRIPEAADVAAWLGTPGDLDGCVVYIDPPYVGTTGYTHELPRGQVVSIARRYAMLGATVAISEAAPISMGPGWRTIRLTGERKGQKRTFSKQKEEWLTVYPGKIAA